LAGCGGWEEFAIGDNRIEYHKQDKNFVPKPGDIVIYDRVFMNQEHDHIGIILKVKGGTIVVAEGNTYNDNISGVIERTIDEHIRAYIRIPDGFQY
jgi:hypothetical protein